MSSTLAIDAIPHTRVDRLLTAYLEGRLSGDRLKADLYVEGEVHRARQTVRDDAARYRALDAERFQRLERLLGVDRPGVEAFVS